MDPLTPPDRRWRTRGSSEALDARAAAAWQTSRRGRLASVLGVSAWAALCLGSASAIAGPGDERIGPSWNPDRAVWAAAPDDAGAKALAHDNTPHDAGATTLADEGERQSGEDEHDDEPDQDELVDDAPDHEDDEQPPKG